MGRKTCRKYIFQRALRFAVLAAYYWLSAGTCVSWRAENTKSIELWMGMGFPSHFVFILDRVSSIDS